MSILRWKELVFLGGAAAASLLFLSAQPAMAQVVCPQPVLPAGGGNPALNQDHIYCGDWNAGAAHGAGAPRGFHSQPGGNTPANRAVAPMLPALQSGIYNGMWNFVGIHAPTQKFSTFFPDSCTMAQVNASIFYAAANPVVCNPAVPWGNCGPNRPDPVPAPAAGTYCLGDDAANGHPVWQIRHAFTIGGMINTAFPNP